MRLHLPMSLLMMGLVGGFGCATTQSAQSSNAGDESAAHASEAKADCCKDGVCSRHATDNCCKDGVCAHAKKAEAKADCCKDGVCSRHATDNCCKDGVCAHAKKAEAKADCCKDGVCARHAKDNCCKDGVCAHAKKAEAKADCCKDGVCAHAKKAGDEDDCCKDGVCAHAKKKGHACKHGAAAPFAGPAASLVAFPDPAASTKGLDVSIIVDDPSLALAIITLRNGTPLPEHVRAFPVTIQATTGSGTVTAGEQTFELGAGQVAVLAPHVPHSIQPKGKAPLTLVVHQLRAGATLAPADATGTSAPTHAH